MRPPKAQSKEGKGQKVRCEPETLAAVNEALRLSPWGARTASLHEQPYQNAGQAGDQRQRYQGAETAEPIDTEQEQGGREEPGATIDTQQGLSTQFQFHQRSSRWPAGANLTRCSSPDLKSDAGVQPVKDNLGRGDVAFARNGFAEGAQNGQRVGMRSPVGAPDNWAVRDVLTKERVQMGPIVLVFGLNPGQGAVSTSLTRVRGADGDIQGSVGVAQGRGEDVCGPQVRARDETGNLHFRSVIVLVRCCMQKGRDGVVSPCGLPKGAAGGVRCARIQNARVAGGACDGFHGASATQTKTNRINVLIGFQNQAVTRVEPPQPSVVYRGVAKLRKTRASSPRPFIFMHLQQTLADTGVKARSDDALDLGSLPRVRVLLIAITVINSSSPGETLEGTNREMVRFVSRSMKKV